MHKENAEKIQERPEKEFSVDLETEELLALIEKEANPKLKICREVQARINKAEEILSSLLPRYETLQQKIKGYPDRLAKAAADDMAEISREHAAALSELPVIERQVKDYEGTVRIKLARELEDAKYSVASTVKMLLLQDQRQCGEKVNDIMKNSIEPLIQSWRKLLSTIMRKYEISHSEEFLNLGSSDFLVQ